MTSEQEKILERCKDILNNWVIKDFEKDCKQIIELQNVQNTHDNYLDAYPIFAAVLMNNAAMAMLGSLDTKTINSTKRKVHKYMKFNIKDL